MTKAKTAEQALAEDALRFTRPTSLRPATSVSAQDEILRVAAFEAALATCPPEDLHCFDQDLTRTLMQCIEYEIETLRLIDYCEGEY